MKRFLVCLAFLSVLTLTGAVRAAPYVDNTYTGTRTDYVSPNTQGEERWIKWDHTLDWIDSEGHEGCAGCQFGYSLSLNIVADDVDAEGWAGQDWGYQGEDDLVWIYQGSWNTTSNKACLGTLDNYGEFSIIFDAGPDLDDRDKSKESSTLFEMTSSELLNQWGFNLNPNELFRVRVWVEGDGISDSGNDIYDWEAEIESSHLRVDCFSEPVPVPSAVFLLSSGVLGLVGVRTFLKRK